MSLMHERARFYENYRTVLEQASPSEIIAGSRWYRDAQALVTQWAQEYNQPIAVVASLMAVLSPQQRWDRNINLTLALLEGRPMAGQTNAIMLKAQRVIDEQIVDTRHVMPKGPKVYNFSLNLRGDDTSVTIDSHMLQAAWAKPFDCCRPPNWATYEAYADALFMLADELSYSPAKLQATIWLTWKRLYPTVTKQQLTKQNKG